jgi:uncharacterized protein (TIGR00159 family)
MTDLIPIPTWWDLIDILFLTLVAYHLYLWFRETRALRVLISLVALGGIYSLAKFWGLFLTTWVFQILWQVLLILLLILFQSEIKQVLERVSPLRYLRFKRQKLQKNQFVELAQIVFELARENTGALLVVSRNDNPFEYIHAGHKIMALPEATLIKSIFNRHLPTHDGAAVIHQDRLAQIGCILPLSKSENLPEYLGTRHRAALGLSEVTDAICLVVSEERSEVTTVVDQKMATWNDPHQLAEQLNAWVGVADLTLADVRTTLKRAIVRNWRIMLTSLALVTFMWMVLATQQHARVSIAAPIHHVNISKGLVVEKDPASKIRLQLSGPRQYVNTLRDQDIKIQVDLSNLAAGIHRIKLSRKNVDLPLGVRIDRVTPSVIRVVLKQQESSSNRKFPESPNRPAS